MSDTSSYGNGPLLSQTRSWTGFLMPLLERGGPILTLFSWIVAAILVYGLITERGLVQANNKLLFERLLTLHGEQAALLGQVKKEQIDMLARVKSEQVDMLVRIQQEQVMLLERMLHCQELPPQQEGPP